MLEVSVHANDSARVARAADHYVKASYRRQGDDRGEVWLVFEVVLDGDNRQYGGRRYYWGRFFRFPCVVVLYLGAFVFSVARRCRVCYLQFAVVFIIVLSLFPFLSIGATHVGGGPFTDTPPSRPSGLRLCMVCPRPSTAGTLLSHQAVQPRESCVGASVSANYGNLSYSAAEFASSATKLKCAVTLATRVFEPNAASGYGSIIITLFYGSRAQGYGSCAPTSELMGKGAAIPSSSRPVTTSG